MKKSALVIFKKKLSDKDKNHLQAVPKCGAIVAFVELREEIQKLNVQWIDINDFIEAGSIYEASAFIEELSRLKIPDGTCLSKSFMYKGYELWWMNYNNLFLYFCFPYTRYKKLLEYLRNFQSVYFYHPPYKSLFFYYLNAYKCDVSILNDSRLKFPPLLPFGVLLQIIITLISLPFLMVMRYPVMLFIGDKFDKSKDYDFRMKFIYRELRQKNIRFVEFIRSLESWKKVLQHVFIRRRPVIYSEAVIFVGRFLSIISGGRRRGRKKFGSNTFASETDPEKRFKFLIATDRIVNVYDDIWAIRIMKFILQVIGVKSAFITAVLERNFHSALGCKLNNIPTVGILHGVASKYYNGYDFLPTFDGTKMFSVDKYGLWSEWWKEYYIKNSKIYRPEQLYVSGLMRPLECESITFSTSHNQQKTNGPIKVLFVPGELSDHKEIMPYLLTLMETKDISVHLAFRPYRDAFEKWLTENNPQIFETIGKKRIIRGSIHDAISQCDFVVGTYSTAALEALLQLKPLTFFETRKWGDYFEIKSFESKYTFFAENPSELVSCIKQNVDMSKGVLQELQKKFFGDPYQNGGKWVTEQLEDFFKKTS